jgi:hypothetical protein
VTQPRLGLAGLTLVLPVALLLALGAGGTEASVRDLGPLVTFALPVVAMIGFWWEDWPGTRLRPSWSGWADTIVIVVAAPLLRALGEAITERSELLAGAAFIAMLQLTLVCEQWPLARMPRIAGGVAALVLAWAVALLVTVLDPPGAALVAIGAWQVWLYVAWRGWPLSAIEPSWLRLAVANAVVIGGGVLTYVLARGAGDAAIAAAAGSFVAAGLLLGMLFELQARLGGLAGIVLLGVALDRVLGAFGSDAWVAHTGLNAIGVGIILHVAIGRRWPFAAAVPSPP